MAILEGNQPSTTAQRVGIRRAAHQLLDEPKIFDDPLALRMIGKEDASALQADPYKFEDTPLAPYIRASMAARSRYAEDELERGVQRGITQYVILGAGLDTFAYRNPHSRTELQVFEVDHPLTQTWKRTRLKEAGIALPGNLTFTPVDFETETLAESLRNSGFNPCRCTFFSWLGVTPYLTADAIMATLRFIASAAPGSGVVFDYMILPSLLTTAQFARFDELARRVASVGEPWQASFDPALLMNELRGMGFGYVKDNGPDEMNPRYCANRKDGLRVGGLSHIMCARV
jgi:methyltransferase (TIGR00027 family)